MEGRGEMFTGKQFRVKYCLTRMIPFDPLKLEALCREYHVQRLAVFGSVARGEDTPGSDLDLLVEFEPGRTPGLAYFSLQDELSYLFGQTVDLNTPGFLSILFRDQVMQNSKTLFANG